MGSQKSIHLPPFSIHNSNSFLTQNEKSQFFSNTKLEFKISKLFNTTNKSNTNDQKHIN